MNIFKLLAGKAGKLALSTMQAVGLSAAVGVAGVGAWQMLGTPEEVNPDTAFSSSSEEVVFVAGAPTAGGYRGAAYGEGGEVRSGIRAKLSKDVQLMQQDELRMKYAQDSVSAPDMVQSEQQIAAFKMDGASEGLGMGKNAALDLGGAGGTGGVSVADRVAALSKAAQEASAKTGAAAGDVAAAAAEAAKLGSAGGKWARPSGMATAQGSTLNAQFAVQGSRYGAEGVGGEGEHIGPAGRTPQARDTVRREARFEGGRDYEVKSGYGAEDGNSLQWMQKQSAEIARSQNGSANEGTRVFMASSHRSGGIGLSGEYVTTGAGNSSDDFADSAVAALGSAMGDAQVEVATYEGDREALRREIRDFVVSCNRWSKTVVFKLGGYALRVRKRNKMRDKIRDFNEKWGDTLYETENTQGGYGAVARKVVDKAYANIWRWGLPAKKAEEYGRQYWNDEDAFTDKNPPKANPEDIPTTPYGNTQPDDGLRNAE